MQRGVSRYVTLDEFIWGLRRRGSPTHLDRKNMVAPVAEVLKTFPSDLPLDIVRLIFDKAMEEVPIPVHLALVSRQVQRWVEPWIYRHLTFLNEETFELFYRTFHERQWSSAKPSEFYSTNVHTLYICFDKPAANKLYTLGEVLTSLRAVAAWDDSWGYTTLGFMKRADVAQSLCTDRESEDEAGGTGGSHSSAYPYRNLRRLSLSSQSLHAHDLTFDHRMFRSLTHLDIYFTDSFDWPSLASLCNMTHLSVDMATLADPVPTMAETTTWMETITSYCEHLDMIKVISFPCVGNGPHMDFDLLDKEGNYLFPLNSNIINRHAESILEPLCSLGIDDRHLHPWTRMTIGMFHPLVVIGVLTEDIPEDHLLREYLILFKWPYNSRDWDFSVPIEKHKESWERAEEIIEKRRKEKERRNGVFRFKDIVTQRLEVNKYRTLYDE